MKKSLIKSVEERQAERAEVGKVRADIGKCNSVPALRAEVQRLADIVEKLLAR